jgi:hypothetical protein
MTPDGIFEAAIGQQNINAHIQSSSGSASNVQVYIESVSDPGIVITPATHFIGSAADGVAHLLSWQADFTGASPGKHLVSFIVETSGSFQRIIKKIFVTKITFNPATDGYSIKTPEGVLDAVFTGALGPKNPLCCSGSKRGEECKDGLCRTRETINVALRTAATLAEDDKNARNLLHYLSHGFKGHDPNFVFCAPQVLITDIEAAVTPTPPFAGQYGDLPFQDPWWKPFLALLAFLLLVAAAIAEAVDGSGSVTPGGSGTHDLPSSSGGSCCTPTASGGGTSYVAAGLLAAAATVATIAVASDVRDPFRKGQDHTAPDTETELTIAEKLSMKAIYTDDIIPGKPFNTGIEYKYTRITTAKSYTYTASETSANVHLLNKYVIDAPDVVRAYKRELFVVKAQFYDANDKLFKGSQLFVQCYLIGPAGQLRIFKLQDNGLQADATSSDGTYTGAVRFTADDQGLWKYFVLAQDVNTADPNLEPEEAAQIIGGMILTDQLSITFSGGICPLVADGDVNVIA